MTAGKHPDPFLEARVWYCRRCGGEAYPVDAAWLEQDLVLATFGQSHRGGCPAPRTWTIIIATAAGAQSFPYAPAGNARKAREHYRRNSCRACGVLTGARYCAACRCQAQTGRGLRCVNRAGPAGYCGVHPAVREMPGAISDCRPSTASRSDSHQIDDQEGRS